MRVCTTGCVSTPITEVTAMRIDRFISEQANISRSDAKTMIKKSCVRVNGEVIRSADTKIQPDRDKVTLNGKELVYREFLYIMLNKPDGVVCATRDGLSSTVLELLPEQFRRKGLFPAGRLDKDTEGFVFITDDGALAHRMLSPKNHVEKEYIVTLAAPAQSSYIEKFAEGITIDGGEECMPAQLTLTDNEHVVHLVLHEGKYHQVKRMMEAVGNRVTHLRRVRMGGIVLDAALKAGESREITPQELSQLYPDSE